MDKLNHFCLLACLAGCPIKTHTNFCLHVLELARRPKVKVVSVSVSVKSVSCEALKDTNASVSKWLDPRLILHWLSPDLTGSSVNQIDIKRLNGQGLMLPLLPMMMMMMMMIVMMRREMRHPYQLDESNFLRISLLC